jgi:hypothetical protein
MIQENVVSLYVPDHAKNDTYTNENSEWTDIRSGTIVAGTKKPMRYVAVFHHGETTLLGKERNERNVGSVATGTVSPRLLVFSTIITEYGGKGPFKH